MDERNLKLMGVAVAANAAIVYVGIPILMGAPGITEFADRFIIHPTQPLLTGLTAGFSIGLLAATTYFSYTLLKELL